MKDRHLLFGHVNGFELTLNELGLIVDEVWNGLSNHYEEIHPDSSVVMPNHFHGIVAIHDHPDDVGHGLSEIVRGFKTFSARRINKYRGTPGVNVWQRSFYDHVIRDDRDLDRIREYIEHNPARWHEDRFFE